MDERQINIIIGLGIAGGLVLGSMLLYRLVPVVQAGWRSLWAVRTLKRWYAPAVIRDALRPWRWPLAWAHAPETEAAYYLVHNWPAQSARLPDRIWVRSASLAGCTGVLIRAWSRARSPLQTQHIDLVSLLVPDALAQVAAIRHPAQKTLLLDDAGTWLRQQPDMKAALEYLIMCTAQFRRVLAVGEASLPGVFQPGSSPGTAEFTGDETCQTWQIWELLPVHTAAIRQAIRPYARTGRERRRLAALAQTHPDLWGRPGLIRGLVYRSADHPDFRPVYRTQAVEGWLQILGNQVSRQPSVTEDWWRWLHNVVAWMVQHNTTSIPEAEALACWPDPDHRPGRVPGPVLVRQADGRYGFFHQVMPAWLAASQADKTVPGTWPDGPVFHLEIQIQRFLAIPAHAGTVCRTLDHPELRPLAETPASELTRITRLYAAYTLGTDWRWLRYLHHLRGVYLHATNQTPEPPASMTEAMPHDQVLIYLMRDQELAEVLSQQPTEAALAVAGGRSIPIHALAWTPLRLATQPDPVRRFRAPVSARVRSRAIMRLFDLPLLDLPDPSSAPIDRLINEDREEVRIFERIIGVAEQELFNRVRICLFADGVRNLILENTYRPTLLLSTLEQLTNRLYQVMGEDDEGLEGFGPDDAAQIEDGCWTGRRWLWKRSEAYAYPVHLFMAQPGKVWLVLFGV
ncbi:MAG: hypothetical protein SF053_19520 [Bacteroidia bacterium]|nr:hypothetical protein [Bacteroidia bacterium]